MALGLVQTTPKATGSTAAACTFAAPPTIGNGIVAGVLVSGIPATTCVDNQGNTYSVAREQNGAINSEKVAIYFCPAITATGSPFTVTLGSGVSAALVGVAVEVSGVGGGLIVDKVQSGNGISAAPSSGVTTALTVSDIFGMALAAISATQSSLSVGTIDVRTPGWTESAEQLVLSPSQAGEIDSRVCTGGSGGMEARWTGSASGWWAAAVAAFKAGPPLNSMSVSSISWTPGASGGGSTAINTTGATLLVLSVTYVPPGPLTVSDSKGNTWVGLTARTVGNAGHRFYYVASPTVGTGHTFSVTGTNIYPFCAALAYKNIRLVAPFDVESGATTTGSGSLATGSITPSVNGSLIVSGWAGFNATSNPAVSASLVIRATTNPIGGVSMAAAVADLVQTTAAAINPSWSWSGSDAIATTVAAFKPVAVAAAGRVQTFVILPG